MLHSKKIMRSVLRFSTSLRKNFSVFYGFVDIFRLFLPISQRSFRICSILRFDLNGGTLRVWGIFESKMYEVFWIRLGGNAL